MRILLLSALLAVSSLPALAADTASVSGKWKIHSNIEGNESDVVCSLTQAGDAVSGTCYSSEMKETQASGKVEAGKTSWSYQSEYNGSPITVKYTAKLNIVDGKFSGTVSVDPYGVDGDFTATADK